MKNNAKWIILFAAVCAVCAVLIFAQGRGGKSENTAVITSDGKVIKVVDLSVKEPYEFTVTAAGGGHNKIRVENGRIAVIDADCPDRLCVKQGYAENGSPPIICLPHRLCVEVGGETGIDAAVGL